MNELNEISPNPGLDVVRAVIMNDEGHVLLVQEVDDANWKLPGGKIEPNESVAQAFSRELAEELGVEQINQSNFIKLVKAPIPDSEYVRYIAKIDLQNQPLSATREVAQFEYFSPNNLPETKFNTHILTAISFVS
jgi:8-oxo-dGTP diphosphatase